MLLLSSEGESEESLKTLPARKFQRAGGQSFSGKEKSSSVVLIILQMILLDSEISILDETDSGLDIDALKIISKGINAFMTPDKAIVLITHYQRLLDYVKPNFVHVMQNGKIIKTGTADLALELEKKGYEWLK